MGATHALEGQRRSAAGIRALEPRRAAPRTRSNRPIVSLGALYGHAFAIACEAEARYREFSGRMADSGNDTVAELFGRLAEFEMEHAFKLAKSSVGIEIPTIDSSEYAWLAHGVPAPEACAFIFRMITPRLALEIALRAKVRARAFFEGARDESRNARVEALAAELACAEQSHIDWVSDALARLPRPFLTDEDQPGDPTIEQQM